MRLIIMLSLLLSVKANADIDQYGYDSSVDQRIDQLSQRMDNLQQDMELDRSYNDMDQEIQLRLGPDAIPQAPYQ